MNNKRIISYSRRPPTYHQSRYTIGGLFIPPQLSYKRIYQPTYRILPKNKVNFTHIDFIIDHSVNQQIKDIMSVYDPKKVMQFIRCLSEDIRLRIKIQSYDRMRTVIIVNVMEKAYQGIYWQMDALLDHQFDRYTSYKCETSTFIVNVFVALIYWD